MFSLTHVLRRRPARKRIDIYLQNTGPQTMQSNWLPIPAAPFTVTLRVYWPGETVLNVTWTAPALRETAAPLP